MTSTRATSTTARFESFIAAQVTAGAGFESASSNLTLTTLFLGDITGATQLGEGLFGVDLATNEPLSGGESIRRAVQGGSTVVIIAAGPQALRARLSAGGDFLRSAGVMVICCHRIGTLRATTGASCARRSTRTGPVPSMSKPTL